MTESTEEMREAASILGRMGGSAGTGDAKRRSPAVLARAVKARIAANKKRIAQREQDAKEFKARLEKFSPVTIPKSKRRNSR